MRYEDDEAPRPPSAVDLQISRLSQCLDLMLDLTSSVVTIADRLLGEIPPSSETKSLKAGGPPGGSINTLDSLTADLSGQIEALGHQIERLKVL